MHILCWIIMGIVAGFIASKIVNHSGSGILMDLIIGIIGAFLGGWVFGHLGIAAGGGWIGSLITATIGAIILLLMLDQAIFTVCDFATGVAADKVTRVMGRLGVYVAVATAISCAAFIALPFVASAGAPLLIAVPVLCTVTSSRFPAPPLCPIG